MPVERSASLSKKTIDKSLKSDVRDDKHGILQKSLTDGSLREKIANTKLEAKMAANKPTTIGVSKSRETKTTPDLAKPRSKSIRLKESSGKSSSKETKEFQEHRPPGKSRGSEKKKGLEHKISIRSAGEVDVLVPKQNGSSGDEKFASATVMKGLWKKAFKSLKANGDKPSLLKRSSSLLRRRDSKEGSPDDHVVEPKDIDPVYSLLKCAADLPRSAKTCSSVPCQGHTRAPHDNMAASTSQSSSPTSSAQFSCTSSQCKCSCHHHESRPSYLNISNLRSSPLSSRNCSLHNSTDHRKSHERAKVKRNASWSTSRSSTRRVESVEK